MYSKILILVNLVLFLGLFLNYTWYHSSTKLALVVGLHHLDSTLILSDIITVDIRHHRMYIYCLLYVANSIYIIVILLILVVVHNPFII
jgi:hypothetical protein